MVEAPLCNPCLKESESVLRPTEEKEAATDDVRIVLRYEEAIWMGGEKWEEERGEDGH